MYFFFPSFDSLFSDIWEKSSVREIYSLSQDVDRVCKSKIFFKNLVLTDKKKCLNNKIIKSNKRVWKSEKFLEDKHIVTQIQLRWDLENEFMV